MVVAAGAVDDAVEADGRAEHLVKNEVPVHHEVAIAQATKARVSGASAAFRVLGEGFGGRQESIDDIPSTGPSLAGELDLNLLQGAFGATQDPDPALHLPRRLRIASTAAPRSPPRTSASASSSRR